MNMTCNNFLKSIATLSFAMAFPVTLLAASLGWKYLEEKDKMTDKVTKYAQVESVERDFMGLNSAAVLVIEKSPTNKVDLYFIVTTGMGNPYCAGVCKFPVRIDGLAPEQVAFTWAPRMGDIHQTLRFSKPFELLPKIRASKRLVVEVEIIQSMQVTKQQLEFNTTGLKWE